jgi:predicted secreted hydrolase
MRPFSTRALCGAEVVSRGTVARFRAVLAFAVSALASAFFAMAAFAAAVPDQALDALRASPRSQRGFAIAAAPREFEFPRDHGPHPEFREEWWYLTGNLTSSAGERFGFELTIFRVALAPLDEMGQAGSGPDDVRPDGARAVSDSGGAGRGGLGAGPDGASARNGGATAAPDQHSDRAGAAHSRWRTRQVYLGHFAVTDVAQHTFRFAQKYERDALGLAGSVADPLRVWVDDWQIGGSPRWTLRAQQRDYELQLEVQALAAPILNGNHGLSVKADDPGAASYYYSIPRVSVRGQLVRDRVHIPVSGVAWLDREWGSGSLGSKQAGWDWFALQLDDGCALMFYALRDKDGSRDSHSAGTWVDGAGRTRELSSKEVEITVGDHWDSPRGGRYPSRWHIRVPSLALEADVRPVLANQELGTSPRYWEGAVDVSASRSGTNAAGRGYVELVGYAR